MVKYCQFEADIKITEILELIYSNHSLPLYQSAIEVGTPEPSLSLPQNYLHSSWKSCSLSIYTSFSLWLWEATDDPILIVLCWSLENLPHQIEIRKFASLLSKLKLPIIYRQIYRLYLHQESDFRLLVLEFYSKLSCKSLLYIVIKIAGLK